MIFSSKDINLRLQKSIGYTIPLTPVNKWRKEYLQSLQVRTKWQDTKRSFNVGDVVLLKEHSEIRNDWKLNVIEETYPDKDGLVRIVMIRNANGQKFKCPISKLVLLVENDEVTIVNSFD
jgi:putative ribosome biogenesis GTPase RsgA